MELIETIQKVRLVKALIHDVKLSEMVRYLNEERMTNHSESTFFIFKPCMSSFLKQQQ